MRNIPRSVLLIISLSSFITVSPTWSEKESLFYMSYIEYLIKVSVNEQDTTVIDEFSQKSANNNTVIDEFSQKSANNNTVIDEFSQKSAN